MCSDDQRMYDDLKAAIEAKDAEIERLREAMVLIASGLTSEQAQTIAKEALQGESE